MKDPESSIVSDPADCQQSAAVEPPSYSMGSLPILIAELSGDFGSC
jgi:hypothetical protein